MVGTEVPAEGTAQGGKCALANASKALILGFRSVANVTVGDVVQLVRTLPCHGRGREFESRRPRQPFQSLEEW